MAKEFIVDGAPCMCKFGAAPGMVKVTDNSFFMMNGSKLSATTMTLGNVMYPPGFGVCKVNPAFPKPCIPAVTQWSGQFAGLKTSAGGYPLTDESKGTCSSGSPDCIEFTQTGQKPIPGPAQFEQATAEHQGDLDLVGESAGLKQQMNLQANFTAGSSPRILVKAVTGPARALPGEKVKYQVTKYNVDNPPADVKAKVKWRVEIDGKEQSIAQPNNDVLELTLKQEWAGKELTAMPYLNQSTDRVSWKTKIRIEAIIMFVNGYWNTGETFSWAKSIKESIENNIGGECHQGYWGSQYHYSAQRYFLKIFEKENNIEISDIEYKYWYINGAGIWRSSGGDRYKKGFELGCNYREKLIKLGVIDSSSVQKKLLYVVSHSMGGAFAEGLIKGILPQLKGRGFERIIHFSAADNDDFSVTLPQKTYQFNILPDIVLLLKKNLNLKSLFVIQSALTTNTFPALAAKEMLPNSYKIKGMLSDHYKYIQKADIMNHATTKWKSAWDILTNIEK